MSLDQSELSRESKAVANRPEAEGIAGWKDSQSESQNKSVIEADKKYKDGKDPDIKEAIATRTDLAAQPDEKDDDPTEIYPQELTVKGLADDGLLYEKGGPLPNGELSDGADGLYLAERSKQTGEKLF